MRNLLKLSEAIRKQIKPNQYVFHGTGQQAGQQILQEGFNTTGPLKDRVYFTNRQRITAPYSSGRGVMESPPNRGMVLQGRLPQQNPVNLREIHGRLGDLRGMFTEAYTTNAEANRVFGIGAENQRQQQSEIIQSFGKLLNALKMLQNPLGQFGQQLGGQIWQSRGRPGAGRMSLMGGDAPTYRQ